MAYRGIQILAVLLTALTPISYARAPQKIKGGEKALKHEFPYQVLIIAARDACSGAIIDTLHILTAAHCLYEIDDGSLKSSDSFKVITGSDDWGSRSSENTFTVQSVTPHPSYRMGRGSKYDIGILKLKRQISFDDNKKAAVLSSQTHILAGTEVIFTGWGIHNDDKIYRPSLRKLTGTIVSLTECRAWASMAVIHADKICAWSESRAAVCPGDSGGPLIANGAVIGIAADGSCDGDFPAVFTNVQQYLPWIRENI